MMKTFERSESFFNKILKTFSSKFKKQEHAMLLVTDFTTVSQIANHCYILFASQSFVTLELTNVTSQDHVSLCECHKY